MILSGKLLKGVTEYLILRKERAATFVYDKVRDTQLTYDKSD